MAMNHGLSQNVRSFLSGKKDIPHIIWDQQRWEENVRKKSGQADRRKSGQVGRRKGGQADKRTSERVKKEIEKCKTKNAKGKTQMAKGKTRNI